MLFLTSYPDADAVTATILAGAAGYLLKEIGQHALLDPIERVADGQSILDPQITETVLNQFGVLANAANRKRDSGNDDLSAQENRILALVVEGKTNKEIAADLDLSDKTVKNYLNNAFHKLRVGRRAHAAAVYSRLRVKAGSE